MELAEAEAATTLLGTTLPTPTPPRRRLDVLLHGDNYEIFNAREYFSDASTGHVFDVKNGVGTIKPDLHDEDLNAIIEDERTDDYEFRIILIDCMQPDQEKLSVTSKLLRKIFDTYDISPHFAGFLKRQHMPGRAVHFDQTTRRPHRHELWYSAVIRSTWLQGNETARDLSRKVADWSRFCLWSSRNLSTKQTRLLVWGCPPSIRRDLVSTFQGANALELERHPMLIHAWFAKGLLWRTYDFLQDFSGHLYAWEFKAEETHSSKDYTQRVQAFLALSRQIQQIATDYDVLDATLEHLQREQQWFDGKPTNPTPEADSPALLGDSVRDDVEFRAPLQEIFKSLLREAKLIRTYSGLYDRRTQIGVREGFAMVNQRDAEVNLKVAAESAQIALASHQDSRALRIIQILSMLFLPPSLISSIFGMGFFSTSQGANGEPLLLISSGWWLFVAISVPLTVLCVALMGGYSLIFRFKENRKQVLDMEKARPVQLKED